MKFKYRIAWINAQKNRQELVEVNSQDIAIFIAKKKVYEGMKQVLIGISGELGEDENDASWPAIDAAIVQEPKQN